MEFLKGVLGFDIGSFTVFMLLKAIIILLACMLFIRIASRTLDSFLEKSKIDKSLHRFIKSMAKIGAWLIAVILIADCLKIPLTSLLAVFSIAGLAASLAMQDTLSNFASGVLILMTRPFNVGDYIECGGDGGTVTSISLVYTEVRTMDNKVIFLPNSDVSSSKITNFTKESHRRIDLEFTASYDCPVEDVKNALLEAVSYVPSATDVPEAPFVSVNSYDSSSISYILKVWCETPDYWKTFYAIKEAVKQSFDKNSIEMTYDHLNVHIDSKN